MSLAALARPPAAGCPAPGSPAATPFSVPARHNARLQAVVQRLAADEELRHLWHCAQINAVERVGLGGSGDVHARIVANAALRLLRLLREAGLVPGGTAQHHLSGDEVEVVVVLAAALHDLGLAVSPHEPGPAGLMLARAKGLEVLDGLYPSGRRTVLVAEMLQVLSSQPAPRRCLTLEASVLRLADALDLAHERHGLAAGGAGRSGPVGVDEVAIVPAGRSGARVVILLRAAADLAALEAHLRQALRGVALGPPRLELVARLPEAAARDLVALNLWEGAQ